MITNEVIWITGATSGLGKAIAKELGKNNTLILSGRNEAVLSKLQENYPNSKSLPCDLTAISPIELENKLSHLTDHLDRIILSAGDCKYFDIDTPNWQLMNEIMNINFSASVKCIEASLPLLKKAPKGHIVAISSMATQAAFPKAEAYGASKAALSYFLSSLRIDLAPSRIDITDVLPGFIDTPLTQKNTFDMPFLMSDEKAAKRITSTLEKRPLKLVFPKRLSVLFKLLNAFPRLWIKANAH